jgi:peptidoglycan/xylan/chitin deacetylase (PgdA/CDA1 family)
VDATGRVPTLFRPPYGHFGGAAALAATRLDYHAVLWSVQMVESQFPNNPAGHARHIIQRVEPGTILLGHDVGAHDRLVAIRGLPDMIKGLRERGYQFMTVSRLMAETSNVL